MEDVSWWNLPHWSFLGPICFAPLPHLLTTKTTRLTPPPHTMMGSTMSTTHSQRGNPESCTFRIGRSLGHYLTCAPPNRFFYPSKNFFPKYITALHPRTHLFLVSSLGSSIRTHSYEYPRVAKFDREANRPQTHIPFDFYKSRDILFPYPQFQKTHLLSFTHSLIDSSICPT